MRRPGGQKVDPHVCMVAYSDYLTDARVRREAETLASSGFEVLCLKTRNGSKAKQYSLNGVQIRELPVPKYQGKSQFAYFISYCRFLVAASAACLGLVMKRQVDVVHVHNLPDFLVFAGLLPRFAGRKVVLDIHDSVPETFATKFSNSSVLRRALYFEERLSSRVAHYLICVNEPQRNTLLGRGIPVSKTTVSMNVPDPTIFHTSRGRQPSTASEHFDIVYHGTMAERLGVDLILRTVELLRDRIPEIRVHLWGRGDDLESFVDLASALRLEDCTDFRPDGVALEDLPAALQPMRVGVVGNRRSPASDLMLPVKLMEYIALGIPTVVPRLRTIEYYFSDDQVCYYEPENIQSFADGVYRLYGEPELRYRQAERAATFLDTYGWKQQGGEFVRFYRKLVESR